MKPYNILDNQDDDILPWEELLTNLIEILDKENLLIKNVYISAMNSRVRAVETFLKNNIKNSIVQFSKSSGLGEDLGIAASDGLNDYFFSILRIKDEIAITEIEISEIFNYSPAPVYMLCNKKLDFVNKRIVG